MIQEHIFPATVTECLQALQTYRDYARIIAGGTDLVPQLKKKLCVADCLIDISEIPELMKITESNGEITIGAGVTHAQVAASPIIKSKASLLAKASLSVGSPQIRNIATLAGNVVNAQPAADGAVALIALGAQASISSSESNRADKVENLYLGIGRSTVDSTREVLTSFSFPALEKSQCSSFLRIAPRKALSLPVLNTAVVLTIDGSVVKKARIVLGPVADRPFRARQAEMELTGKRLTEDTIKLTASAAARECTPRESLIRGSAEYRKNLIEILVERAILEAIEQLY